MPDQPNTPAAPASDTVILNVQYQVSAAQWSALMRGYSGPPPGSGPPTAPTLADPPPPPPPPPLPMNIVFPAPVSIAIGGNADAKQHINDIVTVSAVKLLWEAEFAKLVLALL